MAKNGRKLIEIAAPDFDLALTLDSGQTFHWESSGAGFVGAIGERAVYVEQRGARLFVNRDSAELCARYFA
ncbi:MAG: DNA glycosylase, partial [Chthoniobacterales bacterium]